jgi:hypothetical protein
MPPGMVLLPTAPRKAVGSQPRPRLPACLAEYMITPTRCSRDGTLCSWLHPPVRSGHRDGAALQTALISAWPAVMRLAAEGPSRIRQERADRVDPAAVRELILRPDTPGGRRQGTDRRPARGRSGSPRSGMATTARAGAASHPPPGPAPRSGNGQLPGGQQVQQTRQKCQFLQPIRYGKPTRSTRREQPKRLVASAVSGGPCARSAFPADGLRGCRRVGQSGTGRMARRGRLRPCRFASSANPGSGHRAGGICRADLSTNLDRLHGADVCWARLIISVTFVRM